MAAVDCGLDCDFLPFFEARHACADFLDCAGEFVADCYGDGFFGYGVGGLGREAGRWEMDVSEDVVRWRWGGFTWVLLGIHGDLFRLGRYQPYSNAAWEMSQQLGMPFTLTDSNKGRLDHDLPLAAFWNGDIVFDLDVFFAVVAGCFHGGCHCG